MVFIISLVVFFITGLYCLNVAEEKGYNGFLWFIGGFLFSFRGTGKAFEKIEMESMEQCEEQGKVFMSNVSALNRYICLKGK